MDHTTRLRELSAKYLSDSCSRDELNELLNMLKRAEKESEIKEILSELWEQLSEEDYADEELTRIERDDMFDIIIQQADKRDRVSGQPLKATGSSLNRSSVSRRKLPQWAGIAAILAVSVFLSIGYFSYEMEETVPVQEVVYQQRVAAPGEKVQLILSDGTQVNLNSGSRIEFPESFESERREVRLEGEAYFVVTHDRDRPFLVHSGDIVTRVLGTTFNVRSYTEDRESVVAVASGKVAVGTSDSDLMAENYDTVLEANQWTSYQADANSFETGNGDISLLTAWNHGVLYYANDTLEEVARKFERWYGVTISFSNESIKSCVIRGEHRDETLRNVLESITYAFDGMSYEIIGKRVDLAGKGCA